MLERLFKKRASRRRHLHGQVAALLLARLGRERSLSVDKALLDEFKIDKRSLLRIASDLALKERLHLLAEPGGRVLLLANAEFRRCMLRRSGASEEEIALAEIALPEVPEPAVIDVPSVVPAVSEPAAALSDAVPSAQPVAASADDFDWFTLDVAPSKPKRGKMPPKRQSLPDRARDPWSVLEGAGLD